MIGIETSTAVGVFASRSAAEQAVHELHRAGFHADQLGIMARNEVVPSPEDDAAVTASGAALGAAGGGVLGAIAGFIVVSGVLPGVGPFLAGGSLAILLGSAAVGAATVGIVGALAAAQIPEEEAHFYEREVKAGHTIVTVQAEDRHAEAELILRRCGALDVRDQFTHVVESGMQTPKT